MSKEDDQANESENNNDEPVEPTEEEQAAALDKAVSDGVDEATPTITPEKEDDDQTPEEKAAAAEAEAAEAAAAETQTPEEKAAAEAEAVAAAEAQTPEEKAAAEAEAAAAAEAQTPEEKAAAEAETAAAAEAEKVDPVNDPIPESTNEKTSERIKSLIGIIKEKETAEVQRDEILDEINATGAQPEQYAATLGFLKLYNSTDATERKQALVVARGLVKELALDLGEGASVADLGEYDDLAAEVETGKLTEERALEIAGQRDAKALQDSRGEQARNKQDDTALTNQNLLAGRKQLDSFEGAMKSADKNYAKIRPAFIKLLKPVLKRTHPTEWGAAALELYEEVKLLPLSEQPKPKPKPKNEPLRPKSDTGGGADPTPEAGSAVDAIDQALANM